MKNSHFAPALLDDPEMMDRLVTRAPGPVRSTDRDGEAVASFESATTPLSSSAV
jgi:hypothetical protein